MDLYYAMNPRAIGLLLVSGSGSISHTLCSSADFPLIRRYGFTARLVIKDRCRQRYLKIDDGNGDNNDGSLVDGYDDGCV
jgi:hypothetical protein